MRAVARHQLLISNYVKRAVPPQIQSEASEHRPAHPKVGPWSLDPVSALTSNPFLAPSPRVPVARLCPYIPVPERLSAPTIYHTYIGGVG